MTTENNLLRVPIFDGTEKTWNYWSNTFESVLEQKKLGEIVAFLKNEEEIPEDDDDCQQPVKAKDGSTSMVVDASLLEIQKQNKRAFAVMLSSMNAKLESGKAAWNLIMLHKDASAGYSSGNFKRAFKTQEELYRPMNKVTLGELKAHIQQTNDDQN